MEGLGYGRTGRCDREKPSTVLQCPPPTALRPSSRCRANRKSGRTRVWVSRTKFHEPHEEVSLAGSGRTHAGHGGCRRTLRRVWGADKDDGRPAACGSEPGIPGNQAQLGRDTSRTAFLPEKPVALQKDRIFTGSPAVYEDTLSSWELVCVTSAVLTKAAGEYHTVACDQGPGFRHFPVTSHSGACSGSCGFFRVPGSFILPQRPRRGNPFVPQQLCQTPVMLKPRPPSPALPARTSAGPAG